MQLNLEQTRVGSLLQTVSGAAQEVWNELQPNRHHTPVKLLEIWLAGLLVNIIFDVLLGIGINGLLFLAVDVAPWVWVIFTIIYGGLYKAFAGYSDELQDESYRYALIAFPLVLAYLFVLNEFQFERSWTFILTLLQLVVTLIAGRFQVAIWEEVGCEYRGLMDHALSFYAFVSDGLDTVEKPTKVVQPPVQEAEPEEAHVDEETFIDEEDDLNQEPEPDPAPITEPTTYVVTREWLIKISEENDEEALAWLASELNGKGDEILGIDSTIPQKAVNNFTSGSVEQLKSQLAFTVKKNFTNNFDAIVAVSA